MKAVKSIFTLLILLVFLFGTTGMSVFHHFCNSSNEHDVTFYPEIFDGSGDSCCADEEAGYACSHVQDGAVGNSPLGINAPPCCKTILTFHKLEITTVRYDRESDQAGDKQCATHERAGSGYAVSGSPKIPARHFQFHSPPFLAGKKLVLFLCQQRIPFPPSVA